MSDQPTTDNDDREIPGLDEHLDAADQDTRIGSDETDDLPVTPPEQAPRATEHERAGLPDDSETIDERLSQEEPDPGTAYGDPGRGELDERPRVGGDDPDSIPADADVLGDSGVTGAASSDDPAEESAMHVEDDEPL